MYHSPMPENILLVDDDNEFRAEFRDYFGEYRIREASTAEDALKLLQRPNSIDLVLLDVRMPGMGGLKALAKVREAAPGAAVILMTGFGSKEVVIEALRGGAGDYLEKPFDLERARRLIERALAAAGGEEDAGLTDAKGKIEKVKSFIRRNCLRKVRLCDAAAEIFVSPKHLSRIFRAQTGTGFNEYYLRLKMEKAKELLAGTGYSVDHISEKLGYGNTESFIRLFRKFAGTTPAVYRSSLKSSRAGAAPGRKGKKSRRPARTSKRK